jgi:hypothetical protein
MHGTNRFQSPMDLPAPDPHGSVNGSRPAEDVGGGSNRFQTPMEQFGSISPGSRSGPPVVTSVNIPGHPSTPPKDPGDAMNGKDSMR